MPALRRKRPFAVRAIELAGRPEASVRRFSNATAARTSEKEL
jgi:hypothetical protein